MAQQRLGASRKRTNPRAKKKGETVEEEPTGGSRGGSSLPKRKDGVSPEVERIIDTYVDAMTTLGVEGLRRQFREQLAAYRAPDDRYKFTAFEANPDKNRYLDVVCLDYTRVHLTLDVPPSTDYIHANWVKFDGHDKVFIAAQAPLDNTIEDFWRMVFQEGCPNVVNLTKCVEDGKIKSSQYWPLEPGAFVRFGKMFVNTKKVESEGRFLIYTVEVLPEGCSNSNIVKVIHMTSWPDRGLPISGRHVLRLIRQVNGDKLDNGPIVMHCSAGIGRTGTIILIDVILRRLFCAREVDMVDLFKQLRNQRASCIQVEGQYIFVIVSVLDYIKVWQAWNDSKSLLRPFRPRFSRTSNGNKWSPCPFYLGYDGRTTMDGLWTATMDVEVKGGNVVGRRLGGWRLDALRRARRSNGRHRRHNQT